MSPGSGPAARAGAGQSGAERAPTGRNASRFGLLAAALLALELVAGMQSYLLATLAPVVAADLDAQEYYGVMTATAQVAMFLTMPLGPYLLHRFRVDRLLLHLTWLSVLGGAASALAPSIGVFLLGRAASGLASGALATVSLAAIVTVLPAGWRRAVLAGYNAMWLATSLVGPAYAGWIASVLSWRWALVLYLPLLVLARVVVARRLGGSMPPGTDRERLTVGAALVLAGGVALLSVVGLTGVPAALAAVLGLAGTLVALLAARRLLPGGMFRPARGRPAALATMGLATASYFGASSLIAIVVHDLLGGTAREVAAVLACGGLGWALTGLAVSRWPAREPHAYARRAAVGAALIAVGVLGTGLPLVLDVAAPRVGVVLVGWSVAGVGMGLVYLDTLNHIVEVPPETDGVSVPRAAAAAVLVESIATAVTTTAVTAVVGRAVAGGAGAGAAVLCLALTVLVALAIVRVAPRTVGPGPVVPSGT
ncbi:MAG TPA: MFS transporter [Cellulomonas sp.]